MFRPQSLSLLHLLLTHPYSVDKLSIFYQVLVTLYRVA
jgi:hypothetical protein